MHILEQLSTTIWCAAILKNYYLPLITPILSWWERKIPRRKIIDYVIGQYVLSWPAPRAGKMNQIARCDWLPERARWTIRCIPHEKFPRKPYNKSFIDQVCSVKMVGYWPRSFFCEFMDLDFVSVHKHAKKNLANIQPT